MGALTATLIAIGTLATAAAGVGISAAQGRKAAKRQKAAGVAPQPLPAEPEMGTAAETARTAVTKRQKAKTRTIYTSPLGLTEQAQVTRKTVLGQ